MSAAKPPATDRLPAAAPVADVALSATRENVPQLRRAVVHAARDQGVSPELCQHLALAVSEAATNAVIHAFADAPGEVRATLWVDDATVELVLADDGRGLALRSDSPGLGMGLGLIAKVSDRMEIDSAPGSGTTLRLWFTRG